MFLGAQTHTSLFLRERKIRTDGGSYILRLNFFISCWLHWKYEIKTFCLMLLSGTVQQWFCDRTSESFLLFELIDWIVSNTNIHTQGLDIKNGISCIQHYYGHCYSLQYFLFCKAGIFLPQLVCFIALNLSSKKIGRRAARITSNNNKLLCCIKPFAISHKDFFLELLSKVMWNEIQIWWQKMKLSLKICSNYSAQILFTWLFW